MAETPETPEETNDASSGADEAAAVEASADEAPAAAEASTDDTPAAAAPKAAPKTTRRERMDERRAARTVEASKRPARTPEERDAERREARKVKAAERRRYRTHVKAKAGEHRSSEPVPEQSPVHEHGPGRPKVRQGVVVSDKADKTIVVRLDRVRRHRRYRKIVRSTVTLHAHDERNDAHTGDIVRVQECRPMSRSKRWRLIDVLERAR
jgi:small subunit ribosomal protein S17